MKKKFKDTKVGKFLSNNGSNIANTLADVLPTNGILSIVKRLIDKDDTLPLEDKEKALKLLEIDMVEMQEITKRWSSDLASDNSLILFIFLDSIFIDFNFDEVHIETLKQLCSVVFIAYFGGRSYEKTRK